MSARLLIAGREVYGAMWEAIDTAQSSVQLETYIWKGGRVADRFLGLLESAARRGVRVELLLDCFGSDDLPVDYFARLKAAGARLVWFNPTRVLRYSFRNHRKLLVIDGITAIVGGLNVADEYDGDGITEGWRDFAVELRGEIVAQLADSFVRMQQLARFTPRTLRRFARASRKRADSQGNAQLLVSGPGTRTRSLRHALREDLRRSNDVGVYAAYLLPPVRMRQALRAAARRGRVRMITSAHSDVPLVQWAAQRLYGYWLRGGVQLHEYLPQVMHGKLVVIDDVVYIGSANLDVRSLRINYELLVRIESEELATQVRASIASDVARSRQLHRPQWRAGRRWWHLLRSWWAYLLLVRVDPYLAWRKLRRWA
jgi:cardiolipin synthase